MVAAKKSQKDDKTQKGLAQRASGVLSKPVSAVTTGALERALLAEFPAADAEAWDRTGMTVGDPARLVTGVAVALDPTVEAIENAANAGANVLVTHHPAFLAPPSSFMPASSVAANPGAGVWRAVERGVSILSYHTALDVSVRAQRVLPGMLNLNFQQVLVPIPGSRDKGYGQLCTLGEDDGLTLGQLAARCTSVFGRTPRVWGDFPRELDRVVTATGSAGDLGRACLQAQVDCLVCGEIKYHDALELSQAGLAIIDLGHDTSELPLVAVLADAVESVGIPGDLVMVVDQGDNWSYPETLRV
ncbi:Nif3-like dinuclear metal center hexameric protein [Eggerthella sinensis]|uniref:GTP cyclohydrolase 1 type 2 homolog n=1 Tax=Eggerthella sinensis TaxID=242230 RepID=A0A3N0IQY2_9ACTN|nr:Nif3-like dinuclear metal center hexameric protein [Eggerthella sinensis]MCB7037209.1 Nif3-like dinuclear metal center hexameric protein [Eggerthella sinensis]RDB70181.1 NGG1p interacting factor NIF3 [Eggerthella sinensis]RNM39394.1 NGG1p interacting factor NIF3 [Eggerthella sinensis]